MWDSFKRWCKINLPQASAFVSAAVTTLNGEGEGFWAEYDRAKAENRGLATRSSVAEAISSVPNRLERAVDNTGAYLGGLIGTTQDKDKVPQETKAAADKRKAAEAKEAKREAAEVAKRKKESEKRRAKTTKTHKDIRAKSYMQPSKDDKTRHKTHVATLIEKRSSDLLASAQGLADATKRLNDQ